MGVDVLDLEFRLEETFHVQFAENELTELARDHGDISVGTLYDCLLTKMGLRDVARNDLRLNHHLWAQVQRSLSRVTDAPLDEIELKSPLETLFPRDTRREKWNALRDAAPYRIRDLDYPIAVRTSGFLLSAGMVLVEQFQLWQVLGIRWLWPLLGVVGIWMVGETYLKFLWLCAPLRNRFPARMKTVKDLCRVILAANYVEICESAEIPLDQRCLAVWQELVGILVAVLGVEPDEVTFHSRLIRDLGMS